MKVDILSYLQRKLMRQEVPAMSKVHPTAVGLCSPSMMFSATHSYKGLQVGMTKKIRDYEEIY